MVDGPGAARRAHGAEAAEPDAWCGPGRREEGRAAHPESVGGQRCRHDRGGHRGARVPLQAMARDGPGRRSIQVTHRNLERAPLPRLPLRPRAAVRGVEGLQPPPAYREDARRSCSRRQPAEWTVELPPTPDFGTHLTFVTPPLKTPGLYLLVASARRDFARRQPWRRPTSSSATWSCSPAGGGGRVEVRVSGASGPPLRGGRVSLYRFDWQQGHRRSTRRDRRGRAVSLARASGAGTPSSCSRRGRRRRLRRASNRLLPGQEPARGRTRRSCTPTAASTGRGRSSSEGPWPTSGGDERSASRPAAAPVTVRSSTPTARRWRRATLTTNDFGSAAGELASRRAACSAPGGSRLARRRRRDPGRGVQAADLRGHLQGPGRRCASTGRPRSPARRATTSACRWRAGSVAWRVTREPVYPLVVVLVGPGPPAKAQIVASGATALDADGRSRSPSRRRPTSAAQDERGHLPLP